MNRTREAPRPPCEECGALVAHEFRTPDDCIEALRVAAQEMDRGVLARVDAAEALGPAAQEALDSLRASGAYPDIVHYRFRCTVCGDRFTLIADTEHGRGGWSREFA